MEVRRQVQRVWQKLSNRERRILKSFAKASPDAGLRARCKIVLSLVQDNSPTAIARVGQASQSQVYRVAQRFVQEGPRGLSDRREDNGDPKVTDAYEWTLLLLVVGSPLDFALGSSQADRRLPLEKSPQNPAFERNSAADSKSSTGRGGRLRR